MLGHAQWHVHYVIQKKTYTVSIMPINEKQFKIHTPTNSGEDYLCTATFKDNQLSLEYQQRHEKIQVVAQSNQWIICTPYAPIIIARTNQTHTYVHQEPLPLLTSPMPATIIAVLKNPGDFVCQGEALMILEAMKMEHIILAPHDGRIDDIFFQTGTQVLAGVKLANISTCKASI